MLIVTVMAGVAQFASGAKNASAEVSLAPRPRASTRKPQSHELVAKNQGHALRRAPGTRRARLDPCGIKPVLPTPAAQPMSTAGLIVSVTKQGGSVANEYAQYAVVVGVTRITPNSSPTRGSEKRRARRPRRFEVLSDY